MDDIMWSNTHGEWKLYGIRIDPGNMCLGLRNYDVMMEECS